MKTASISNPFLCEMRGNKKKTTSIRTRTQVAYQWTHAWHSIRNIWCSPQRTSKWKYTYKYKMNANLCFTIIQQQKNTSRAHAETSIIRASWTHWFAQFCRFAWIDSWCLPTAHNDYCNWMLFLCLCFSLLWPGLSQCQSLFCIVSYAAAAATKWLNCRFILCDCTALSFT